MDLEAFELGSTLVEVESKIHWIRCPEHGVSVTAVSWAYPGSHLTKDFDLTIGRFAVYLPRGNVSKSMQIDGPLVAVSTVCPISLSRSVPDVLSTL